VTPSYRLVGAVEPVGTPGVEVFYPRKLQTQGGGCGTFWGVPALCVNLCVSERCLLGRRFLRGLPEPQEAPEVYAQYFGGPLDVSMD
jgi:hypothetical protein